MRVISENCGSFATFTDNENFSYENNEPIFVINEAKKIVLVWDELKNSVNRKNPVATKLRNRYNFLSTINMNMTFTWRQ